MVYVVVFSVMMMVMFVGVCGASASLERRKEIRELTSEEWDRFAGAVNEFRLSGRWEKIANKSARNVIPGVVFAFPTFSTII